ncbi:MAG: hypothetical protein JST61_00220 [Acidobacteria bacterium]|nr:hypothetical protein [Acidobacteriota bacterium]
MKMTPDTQKKAVAVGLFALLAGGILYYQLSDANPTPRPAAAPAQTAVQQAAPASRTALGNAAKALGTTSAQLDPTLKMGPMLAAEKVVYSGSGRNIFSANSAPIDIPKPIASARPKTPPPPVITAPLGPPPPPPIDLKFFGTATSANGKRQAFLLHGQDVFLATDGEIVQRRYRIVTVSANAVVVEDMANDNRQTLPLVGR